MIFSGKVYWRFRAFDEYNNILDLKKESDTASKNEHVSKFEHFWTKNKWHFFEFNAL